VFRSWVNLLVTRRRFAEKEHAGNTPPSTPDVLSNLARGSFECKAQNPQPHFHVASLRLRRFLAGTALSSSPPICVWDWVPLDNQYSSPEQTAA
jgi:hypothetical protein